MAEYIEREAFKEKYLCCGYLPEMSENEFDEFPAADVAPVVHGRWLFNRWLFNRCAVFDCTKDLCRCSECNTTWDAASCYCPHCGAKMDGDK